MRQCHGWVLNTDGACRDAREALAADALGTAADIMMAHPLALQLRNLQSLVELGVDKNTTVVFPAPLMSTIGELGSFLARENAAAAAPAVSGLAPQPVPAASDVAATSAEESADRRNRTLAAARAGPGGFGRRGTARGGARGPPQPHAGGRQERRLRAVCGQAMTSRLPRSSRA